MQGNENRELIRQMKNLVSEMKEMNRTLKSIDRHYSKPLSSAPILQSGCYSGDELSKIDEESIGERTDGG